MSPTRHLIAIGAAALFTMLGASQALAAGPEHAGHGPTATANDQGGKAPGASSQAYMKGMEKMARDMNGPGSGKRDRGNESLAGKALS